MTTLTAEHERTATTGAWTLDRGRSTAEFRVRHFWGLHTVTGQFARFGGSYTVGAAGPEIELTIDATSIDTGNNDRDEHLRAADFFDVTEHPQVRFESTRLVDARDGILHVDGELEAAGAVIPLAFDATIRQGQNELEIEATTAVDQRRLGMTWSPLGMLRAPATVHVKARLVRSEPAAA